MRGPSETTVLVVAPERETDVGRALRDDEVLTVSTARSVSAAESQLDSTVDVVVVSDGLPASAVLTILEATASTAPDTAVVLVAFDGDERLAASALNNGADRYVVVNDPSELDDAIQSAVSESLTESSASHVSGSNHHERLVEYSSDIIVIYDEQGRISFINQTVEEVLGYEPADVIGMDPIHLVHPDDREGMASYFAALRDNPGTTRRFTYRFETADGEYRTLESIGRNRLDDPTLDGIVINTRDVTEREERKAELELRETIIEAIPIGIHVLDEAGKFLWVNDEFATMVDEPVAEIIDTEYMRFVDNGMMADWIPEAYTDVVRELLTSSNDTATARINAVPVQTADGEERLFDTHFALLPLEDGEFSGTVTAFREVTERKEYQQQLERQNERLDKFASVISHDLRNPLSVAAGRIDLAAQDLPSENEHLQEAQVALERMERLVENVLTLAREGKVVGETTPVGLSAVVDAAWSTTNTQNATLEVAVGDRRIEADETRLQQLFENLFRNAVEHGSTSPQTKSADAVEHTNPAVTVTVGTMDDGFFVADDGPGIPKSEREDLFEETYSLSTGGFGLSIVGTIASAHGWSVTVTDSEAGGARFEFIESGAD